MATFAVGHSAVRPAVLARRARPARPCAVRVFASSAGGPVSPYDVLGLAPGADSDRVRVAYNLKYSAAKKADDQASMARVENAYNKILMSALSSRVSSPSRAVAADVRYADQEDVLRWRPRLLVVDKRGMAINGAIASAALAWAIFSEYAKFNPSVCAALVFMARLIVKLTAFSPSPADTAKAKITDTKRLLRSVGLTMGAFAFSAVLTIFLPTYGSQMLRLPLPLAYYGHQMQILNVVSIVLMAAMASFAR